MRSSSVIPWEEGDSVAATMWDPTMPQHNQRRGIQHHQPTHSISSRSIVSRVDHNLPTQATLSLLSHPFLHLRSQGLAETIIFSSQFSCLLFSIFFLFALHVEIHSPFTLGFILHVPQPPIVLPSHINHFQLRIGSLPSVQLLQLRTLNPEEKA